MKLICPFGEVGWHEACPYEWATAQYEKFVGKKLLQIRRNYCRNIIYQR